MILDDLFRYLRQRKAVKIIDSFPGKIVVCDIGCGSDGNFLKKTSNFLTKGFSFDKEANFYNDAKIKLDNADFEKEKIPLKEATVDIVTMLAVLEHLENPENILREIIRILKLNGFLTLTTPTVRAKSILQFLAALRIINKKAISEHKKYYSQNEIEELLLNSGFQEENLELKHFELGFNSLVLAKKQTL